MKVFYFTFLVLFLSLSLKVNAKEICSTCTDSSPAAQAECWACLGRNKAAQNSIPKQSISSSTSSSTSAKTTTPKSSVSTGAKNNKTPSEDRQSSATQSCGENTYPTLTGCAPCPGNQTIPVNGKVYCGTQESAENSKKPECLINGGEWDDEKQSCMTYSEKRMLECSRENKVWNESKNTCENSTASTTDSHNCIEQFDRMKEQCFSEASSAMTSCNENNEEMQAAENTAKIIGAGSVASIQVACSKIGELSKIANGAFSGWKALCSTNQGGCTESCSEAKRLLDIECIESAPKEVLKSTFYTTITDNIRKCESYKEKIAQATQHAAAALAQLKASEQCKEDTSNGLVNNAVDQCKVNPTSPLCKDLQKCSDANFAAQNPICACADNPTGASCLQVSANYGSGASVAGATLPGVKGGKDITGLSVSNGVGSENGQAAVLGVNSAPGMDGQSVGGRQGDASSAGNSRNGGSGGGAGGSGYYAGGGNEKDPLKVNSGTLGGAPGMGPGFFGRNTASSGGSSNALNAQRGDMAKFDPRKYITGLSGKGEFINSANQNIFSIVKMRYEDKRPSLLPENFNLKK